ncbi:MAG: hypothetical protein MR588_08345 [Bacteroidales bacterium]|nr:hypothetical protein [Bacteroidales bacterium]
MKRSTVFFAIALLLSSCSKQPDSLPEFRTVKLSFNADMPVFSEADTRSSLSSVIRLSWEAGDNVRVFNYSRGKMMDGVLTADRPGKTSCFSGELSGEFSDTDSLLFIHSKGIAAEYSDNGASFDFSEQIRNRKTSQVPVFVVAKSCLANLKQSSVSLDFSFAMALIQVNLNTIPLVEGADSLFYGAMVTGVNPVISFSSEGGSLVETVSAKCFPEDSLECREILFFYADVDENNVPTTDVEPIKLPETASLTLFLTCPKQEKAERSVVVYVDGSSYIADFTAAEIKSGVNYFTGNKSVFQYNDVTGDEGGDVSVSSSSRLFSQP